MVWSSFMESSFGVGCCGGTDQSSNERSAPSSCGSVNVNPDAVSTSGTIRWLVNSSESATRDMSSS